MRPRTMLLAVSAMATLRCSSGGGICGDGTKAYGFCTSDAASDAASALDAAPSGFYGFADAGPYDAASDTSADAGDASDDASDANAIDARFDGP